MKLSDPALANKIKSGAVGVIPTDTVYGLVASAHDPVAVRRILELKGRKDKPGTLIAANLEQLALLGIPAENLRAVEQYWPGAISIVLPTNDQHYLHTSTTSLAVRIPDKPELITLLQQSGPLLTTSANLTGEPTVSSIVEAQNIFADKLDFYVDGGDLSNNKSSTIIQIDDGKIVVLRAGAGEVWNYFTIAGRDHDCNQDHQIAR